MRLDEHGLHNDVVRLDLLEESDRERLGVSGAIEAMWNWMPVLPSGTSYNSYFDYVLKMKERGDIVPFTVTRQSDGAFAGVVGYININRTHRRVSIGYVWHPEDMRGTAVPKATQMAMIGRAFAARMRRIEFLVADENERAIRSVERLGAKKEGVLRHYLRLADGSWADIVMLSLVDSEIRAAIDLLKDRVAAMQMA